MIAQDLERSKYEKAPKAHINTLSCVSSVSYLSCFWPSASTDFAGVLHRFLSILQIAFLMSFVLHLFEKKWGIMKINVNRNNNCNIYSMAAKGMSAVNTGLRAVVRSSFKATAELVNFLGDAVLVGGIGGGMLGAYDACSWMEDKPPVWANYNNCNVYTTLLENINGAKKWCYGSNYYPKNLTDKMNQKITEEMMASAALIIVAPFASFACKKLGAGAKAISRLF